MGNRRIHNLTGRLGLGLALVAGVTGVSAASAATSSHRTRPSGPAARTSGQVTVLSAGSLDTLMTKSVAPAFHAATGYTLNDISHGSSALAQDIKNGIYVGDVFISASPAVDQTLEGKRNGSWVSWYADFADSPEVLGYYPKSRFATDLKTQPWYDVITQPGFRLGRTDPSQDPGGGLAREALLETASAKHLPALKQLASETSDEFEETTEEADIQTGQLDASFMYEADAISQGSPWVKLAGVNLAGDYTITLLKHAPHTAAAEAFIRFLLGPTGQRLLKADKFGVVSPVKVSGSGVPSALKRTL